MAGVVNTTHTFATNEVITSTLMNNIIDETEFTSDALANATLAIVSGKIKVAGNGITSTEMGANAVTATSILDGVITNAKISASAAISLSKLATEALPSGITVASANIVDGTIVAADIASAAITAPKLDGAQTGTAPIYGVRAWANFNTQSDANVSGTYVRSGTTVTITVAGHGLIAGNVVFIDYTVSTGTAPFDGIYQVATYVDANTFTVTSTASTASTGSVSLKRKTIRASGNISCISAASSNPTIPPSSNDTAATGFYIANFSIAMPNANYSIVATCSEDGDFTVGSGNSILSGSPYNSQCARVLSISVGSAAVDALFNSLSIIG